MRKGLSTYGHEIGFLVLDTTFERTPGDIGNAWTWPFPVLYRVVEGANVSTVVDGPVEQFVTEFVEVAKALEAAGVGAIGTSCGHLARIHRQLSAAVDVPVLSSSLMQVPMVATMIGRDRRVGILTGPPDDRTGASKLTEEHFRGVGWSPDEIKICVGDRQGTGGTREAFSDADVEVDHVAMERDLVATALRLQSEYSDLGAIVLECTNYGPYTRAIATALGLPVFDYYSLVTHCYLGLRPRSFASGNRPTLL